ncbi:hypothetical protein [Streptomyces colonosanans]|uniref:Uncharacterized protein n=1 Tax=Streptomyces colonosanans TaxID=1428652 RepID=A0A1S2NUL1_9ACTN|nr:hypothetical protein [Streptomyces colonosanans]OIJ84534.1 hypothetical protein BIV24_30985 [Streptomyces colonosanans]
MELAQLPVCHAEICERVRLPEPVPQLTVEGASLGLGADRVLVVRGQVPDDSELVESVRLAALVVDRFLGRHGVVQGLDGLRVGSHEAAYNTEFGESIAPGPLVAGMADGLGGGPMEPDGLVPWASLTQRKGSPQCNATHAQRARPGRIPGHAAPYGQTLPLPVQQPRLLRWLRTRGLRRIPMNWGRQHRDVEASMEYADDHDGVEAANSEPYDAVADPRTGTVRLCARLCDTCIFRPGNLMDLQPGRVADMVSQARQAEGHVVCHATRGRAIVKTCGSVEVDQTA